MSQAFQDLLSQGAARMGFDLPRGCLDRLMIHRDLLRKWAAKVNLTTVLDDGGMAERLYLDSALVSKDLPAGASLHDVGSGAGFPGLVLKALRPDLAVTLTEARRKRVSFLKQAARAMGLDAGLDIRWRRLGWEEEGEADGAPDEASWQEVISRASFPPKIWVELGAALVAPGGRLWIMAGQAHGPALEPPGFLNNAQGTGLSLERIERYRLPFCGLERWLVSLRRES